MARIRTIKPEFFRHEKLQELEVEYSPLHPMLVFCALWGHCDKNGVFDWRPKQLALDILPFLWKGSIGEAMGKCLDLLCANNLVICLSDQGKRYGYIPTFRDHQRINGKEAQESPKYPKPEELKIEKHRGSNGEATGKQSRSQEGKGREEEGKGTEYCTELASDSMPPVLSIILNCKALYPITQQDVDDWQTLFPAVDVLGELRKMVAWAEANPTRRKTDKGIRRFVVAWLGKEQDKGHKMPALLSREERRLEQTIRNAREFAAGDMS